MNRTRTSTIAKFGLLGLSLLGLALVRIWAGPPKVVESKTTEVAPQAALATGFQWTMPTRFGPKRADGIVDFHWREASRDYDPTYVNPNSWKVDFNACAADVTPGSTFLWQINSADVANPNPNSCTFSHEFSAQGSYTAKLVRTAPDGTQTPFEATINVKDLLIVSLGDSFASGQGNPDIDKSNSAPARWVDRICARSANAGPAKAAMDIENGDPQTSVTFISFACTGAEINAGIIGAQSARVKPQMDELKKALNGRPIDALVISIGGNDIGFAKLVARCIISRCDTHSETRERLNRALNDLAGGYNSLRTAIASLPAVKKVFITEYPDLVRNESGDFCDDGPADDLLLRRIKTTESRWAWETVIAGLNRKIQEASNQHGWTYVGGIADAFRNHGYCAGANNRWVRTFKDAKRVQGRDGKCDFGIVTSFSKVRDCLISSGTFHPAKPGHEHGYAPSLVDALRREGVVARAASQQGVATSVQ